MNRGLEMSKGYIVVNSFVNNEKFSNLYNILVKSFSNFHIDLEIKTAIELGTEVNLQLKEKPDFVLFWDKDIYLAQRLENLGIKLFNSSRAIELCDNKILMYQELAKHNIRIPKTFIAPKTFEGLGYTNLSFIDDIANQIGYPLVIKEAYGSYGEQVYLAENKEEAASIINKIGYKDFLVQEFIKSSCGKDIRVNVVRDQQIVSILRENKTDFRSNISIGGVGSRFEPEQEYVDLAIKASLALGLDFSGVDVMFGENNEPIICEVNSNPQFASTLKVTNTNLADFIAFYIAEYLRR